MCVCIYRRRVCFMCMLLVCSVWEGEKTHTGVTNKSYPISFAPSYVWGWGSRLSRTGQDTRLAGSLKLNAQLHNTKENAALLVADCCKATPQIKGNPPQTLQMRRGGMVVCGQLLQTVVEHQKKNMCPFQGILESQISPVAVGMHDAWPQSMTVRLLPLPKKGGQPHPPWCLS